MCGLKLLLSLCLLLVLLTSSCHSQKRRRQPVCQLRQSLEYNVTPLADSATQVAPYSGSLGEVTWQSDLEQKPGLCSTQGVLRIVPASSVTKIHIYFKLVKPTGYSFNVADVVNNDGEGGATGPDGFFVAEIHNRGDSLRINENIVFTRTHASKTNINDYFRRIKTKKSFNFQMTVARSGQVVMKTIPEKSGNTISLNDQPMFAFDDLYVSLNRVPRHNFRSGTGLCEVCVSFETS